MKLSKAPQMYEKWASTLDLAASMDSACTSCSLTSWAQAAHLQGDTKHYTIWARDINRQRLHLLLVHQQGAGSVPPRMAGLERTGTSPDQHGQSSAPKTHIAGQLKADRLTAAASLTQRLGPGPSRHSRAPRRLTARSK
jgi:hypothetical protein